MWSWDLEDGRVPQFREVLQSQLGILSWDHSGVLPWQLRLVERTAEKNS